MNDYLDIVGIRLVHERKIFSDRYINSPKIAVDVLANELKFLDREMLLTINFNIKNQIINAHVVSIGGLDFANIDIKNIFKSALLSNSAKLMVIHNHPSGICHPSPYDFKITETIKKACEIMNIEFLDHIVVGEKTYYSLNEQKERYYEKEQKEIDLERLENIGGLSL